MKHRTTQSRPTMLALSLIAGLTIASPWARAQARQAQPAGNENPVYLADSPIASDALTRINELLTQSNLDEAVRLCDEMIRVHGVRLILSDPSDPDRVNIPVRRRVNAFVLAHPALLEAYRRQLTPRAQALLDDEHNWSIAARDLWLTEPGLRASLRQAQTLIEAGRFHAGLTLLNEDETHPDAPAHQHRIDRLRELAQRFVGSTPASYYPPIVARSFVWRSDTQVGVSLEGIVPSVLAQSPLTPVTQLDLLDSPTPSRLNAASWKPTAWCAPLVVGSRLYTNDGYTVSCFDRFTMRPLWRVQTSDPSTEIPLTPDSRARIGRLIEDSTSLSDDEHSAIYAAAGLPRSKDSQSQALLLKLDRDSGREIWSVDITSFDPSLLGATIRGPIVIDSGTVVVTARTSNRRQRLISVSLVGIDAATGEMRWLRPLASAGSLPFQQIGQLAHTPIVRDGVIYTTDMIGLAAAVRIATGEVLWARPLPAPDLYARTTRPSFAGNTPVVNSSGLFVLTSDGTEIMQIDKDSGRTIASRPAERLGESYYLLGIDDQRFACVNTDRVIFYRADQFALRNPRRSPEMLGSSNDEPGIRGRVVVEGGKLLVPVDGGVRLLDPDAPDDSVLLPLDATGNIVALDGQIIVVDQMNASSFLAWETASRLLSDRISEDPGAAISLAELAFRTDRLNDIIPSVQRAVDVVRTQPLDKRNPLRDQLFQSVLGMVRTPATNPDAGEASFYDRMGQENIETLMRVLGELARTHEQGVAYRMQLGSVHERYGRADRAIEAYQGVLDEPALRAAMWEGTGIAVRAGLEASRRIGDIIEREGYRAYEPADTRAQSELEYLGDNAAPEQYQALAQRFPWSRSAPAMLLHASDGYAQNARLAASIDAARSGVDSFDRLSDIGVEPAQGVLESLADRLLSGLIASNRSRDAYSAASSLLERHGSLTLRRDNRPITLEQLAAAAGQSDTLPVLGSAFIDDPRPLLVTGSPVRPAHRLDPGGVLMYAPQLGRLRYLRTGNGLFEPFWDRSAPGDQPPMILWQGPARVLVFWPESAAGDTGTIEAIETSTGKQVWMLHDVRTELEQGSARVADDTARVDTLIPVPSLGSVPTRQLIALCDGQSVVVSDRIGRALGLDLYSGQPLWQRDLPMNRVHDLDLSHGVLGACGVMVVDRARDQRNGSITPVVASIDARSGEPGQVIERFGRQPRWVRVGDRNQLFVASAQRITALDIDAGTIDWVVHDENISDSQNAWITDSRLLVLTDRSGLWTLDPSDGSREPQPIDTRGRINQRGWVRVVSEIGRSTLLSDEGFVSFDARQDILGVDARTSDSALVDIAWGREHAIELGEPSIEGPALACPMTLFDHTNALLLDETTLRVPASLGRSPINAVAVNGGVLIGFGEVSVFVRTQR